MRLILGGARSGKSSRANAAAEKFSRVVYLATGRAVDEEMEKRIARHRTDRPDDWETWEEPLHIPRALEKLRERDFRGLVLLDCVGFWVSNMLENCEGLDGEEGEEMILEKVRKAIETAEGAPYQLIVVSNVVGMGVVPGSELGRQFRDVLGLVNQSLGRAAERVTLMVAGLPTPLKKDGESTVE